MDCDKIDEGCNGGLPENAYKALEKIGGLETEASYPYDGHNDKCQFNSTLVAAKVTGFVEVSKNETEMAAWLVKNGPISIGINANVMQVQILKCYVHSDLPKLYRLIFVINFSVLLWRSFSSLEVSLQSQALRPRRPYRGLWSSL